MAFGSHYLGNFYLGKGPGTLAVLVRTVVRAVAVYMRTARGVGSYLSDRREAVGTFIDTVRGRGRG